MPLFGFLGPISETHITNNTAYNIYANVKMTSKIDVALTIGYDGTAKFTTGIIEYNGTQKISAQIGKKDFTAPPGFSKIIPGQTQKFSPEGSGRRIMEVGTAYLSIYIHMPNGKWEMCCENHPFKENRSFTVNPNLSFVQNNYEEDFRMH